MMKEQVQKPCHNRMWEEQEKQQQQQQQDQAQQLRDMAHEQQRQRELEAKRLQEREIQAQIQRENEAKKLLEKQLEEQRQRVQAQKLLEQEREEQRQRELKEQRLREKMLEQVKQRELEAKKLHEKILAEQKERNRLISEQNNKQERDKCEQRSTEEKTRNRKSGNQEQAQQMNFVKLFWTISEALQILERFEEELLKKKQEEEFQKSEAEKVSATCEDQDEVEFHDLGTEAPTMRYKKAHRHRSDFDSSQPHHSKSNQNFGKDTTFKRNFHPCKESSYHSEEDSENQEPASSHSYLRREDTHQKNSHRPIRNFEVPVDRHQSSTFHNNEHRDMPRSSTGMGIFIIEPQPTVKMTDFHWKQSMVKKEQCPTDDNFKEKHRIKRYIECMTFYLCCCWCFT